MADIIINGQTYNGVETITTQTTGGGTATFSLPANSSDEYTRPSDWLPIPEMDGTKDEIYILNGISLDDTNILGFKISGTGTIDWGDGNSESFSEASQQEFFHQYDYDNLPQSSYTEHNKTKQALVKITADRGLITYFNLAIDYVYMNSDGNTGYSSSKIASDIYHIGANVESCELYCNNSSGAYFTLSRLEIFEWEGQLINTSMTHMFSYCYNLSSVSLGDTGNVTDMSYMFFHCYNLSSVSLGDTSNVTDMSYMFCNCHSLQSVPLVDMGNVTTMVNMFNSCYNLPSVSLSDIGNVTDMSSMFSNCHSLQSVSLVDTGNVTNMTKMFEKCYNLSSVSLGDTRNVTNASSMFSTCYNLRSVPQMDVSNVTTADYMFSSCYSLESVHQLNLSNATSMNYMFNYCYSLQSVHRLIASEVTSMNGMFNDCRVLRSISLVDTSKVSIMQNMFKNCYSLRMVQLDASSVTNMTTMFTGNYLLERLELFNLNPECMSTITLSNLLVSQLMTKQALVDLFNSIAVNVDGYTRKIQLGTTLQGYLANVYVKDSGEVYTAILPTSDTEIDASKTYYTYNEQTGEYTQVTPNFTSDTFYYELKTATWNRYDICESTDNGAMLALNFVTNIKGYTIS